MWHERDKRFDQLEIRLLEGDINLAVHQSSDLGLSGFGYGWVAVSEIRDADSGCEV
jgi:hypothetical protein